MRLSNILKGLKTKKIYNYEDVNVDVMTHNSDDVIAGAMFFCVTGGHLDGNNYVTKALQNGAKVVVSERDQELPNCITIVVDNTRIAMSIMARNFYGVSDEKVKKIAVVGTNGKTTTVSVIAEILKSAGKKVGVIGTNGVYINGSFLPNNFTTPDPIELHYMFSQMVAFGVEIVVMEVTAHAIYYNKIYGIKFDIGVFTNVTNEHLDFFGNMDNYIAVKKSIFDKSHMGVAIVNVDDPTGMDIAKSANIPVVSYGIYNPANVFAVKISMSINNCRFVVNANDEIIKISTSLIGEYNVYNILASITVAKWLGVSNSVIEKSILHIANVPGRLMQYSLSGNRKIIIDFAHTPDGFEKVLGLIRHLRRGRLKVVFGCVGYSDYAKRVAMGRIAGEMCDEVYITTDNLGYEDFDKSVRDISTDIAKDKIKECNADRAEIIEHAYDSMESNDTLIILGKGVEDKQVVKNVKVPYCDVDVVERLVARSK